MKIPTLTVLIATAAISCPVTARADDDPPACQSGQVVVSATRIEAAATHRAVLLAFDLASYAPPCTLTGYPGVDSGAGGPLLRAARTLRGYLGGLPADENDPPTVALTKSEPAFAVVESVESNAVDQAGNGCPTYTSLRVTPPDNTDTQNVRVTLESCALQVHPIGSRT